MKRICKPRFLDAELLNLEEVLQANSYSVVGVRSAVQPRRSSRSDESVSREFVTSAVLSYIQGLTDCTDQTVVKMRHENHLQRDQKGTAVPKTGERY